MLIKEVLCNGEEKLMKNKFLIYSVFICNDMSVMYRLRKYYT